MDHGEATAQAIHAAQVSLLRSIDTNPAILRDFLRCGSAGTVVVLVVPDQGHLERLSVLASRRDLPWAIFVETDYLKPPFGGNPTSTAIAIGPALKSRIKPLVRAYPCLGRTQL